MGLGAIRHGATRSQPYDNDDRDQRAAKSRWQGDRAVNRSSAALTPLCLAETRPVPFNCLTSRGHAELRKYAPLRPVESHFTFGQKDERIIPSLSAAELRGLPSVYPRESAGCPRIQRGSHPCSIRGQETLARRRAAGRKRESSSSSSTIDAAASASGFGGQALAAAGRSAKVIRRFLGQRGKVVFFDRGGRAEE